MSKQPLRATREQVEEWRIEIRTVEDCRPNIGKAGQSAKVDGKEFVEPVAFPAGL
jgi:hypothetical protein